MVRMERRQLRIGQLRPRKRWIRWKISFLMGCVFGSVSWLCKDDVVVL